jgi:DNA-binding transcriptional regulator YhcF (GntR family)
MEELETLFSSRPRVQVLRSFLFQPDRVLSARDLAEQTGVAPSTARKHARELSSIDFLEQDTSIADDDGQERSVWKLNEASPMRTPLHELILMHQETDLEEVRDQLISVGDISMLIVSGVLTGADKAPVDVLVVGEDIDKRQLNRALSRIERSLGTELRFTQFTEDEFKYRQNVYDKLIQDLQGGKHKVLVDTINGMG